MKDRFDGTLESLGHKFIVELQGPILSSKERELLKKLRPIGFCPFAKNFLGHGESIPFSYDQWRKAFAALIKDFKECTGREQIMLAIDHEGGRVVRPPAPITRFPYAWRWGEKVEEISRAMAIELRSLGVNVSFAPVCDIHTNPQNPVIGERAFAPDAATVIRKARTMAKVLSDLEILPCAKHFPGHGDVTVDTHEGLATLNIGPAELEARELAPFRAMIADAIPMIMSAHILFPALDAINPATMSPRILRDILRSRLGFQGVVISDALGMEAVRTRFENEAALQSSIEAKMDMYIVAHRVDLEWALELARKIAKLVSQRRLSHDLLDESSTRIEALVRRLAPTTVTRLDDEVFEQHATLARSLDE